MNKLFKISVLLCFCTQFSIAQSITGIWKIIEDDVPQSHVKVYEEDGKYHAIVVELLPGANLTHCHDCEGEDKGASLMDVRLIRDLTKDDDKLVEGYILDPSKGKEYRCQLSLKNDNTLKVRGYIGRPLFGKSQYWFRVE